MVTNWIKDPPEGLKLQNLALATFTGPALRSYPENYDRRCAQHALKTCESSGSGKQLILHGIPIGNRRGFFTAYVSSSSSFFCRICSFQCCMILQGNSRRQFLTSFATSGESTAWVLLWETRSRQIVVRVCLVAHFNFFQYRI